MQYPIHISTNIGLTEYQITTLPIQANCKQLCPPNNSTRIKKHLETTQWGGEINT
jgi:hypothetical protein